MRLILTTVSLLVFPLALASAQDSSSKVKVQVAASKPAADGSQEIIVTIDVAAGWYIHANPTGDALYAGCETTLTPKTKLRACTIDYPAGTEKREDGKTHRIYEGQVVLRARVQRNSGQSGPLQFGLGVQAC